MSGVSNGSGVTADLYRAAIDLQLRTASTAIPTVAATTLILPTIVSNTGNIQYDSGTGILIAPISGIYTTTIAFNVSVPAARVFYFYIDVDVGAGFAPSRYSARQISLTAATDGQILMSSTNFFPQGTRFKFYFWASNTGTLVSTDIPGTTAGTVTVPAARVMISGV